MGETVIEVSCVWKYTSASVTGTSHHRTEQPCQDASRVLLADQAGGSVLVMACADGAGSAAQSERGAKCACAAVVDAIASDLAEGIPLTNADRDTLVSWFQRSRLALVETAGGPEHLRPFACTLLVAVIGETAAVFGQLGDGAVVVHTGDRYAPVFWPQTGEYANTTNFLTDADYERHIEFARWDESVLELAVMTDGLQRLALDFPLRLGHPGFFEPLFRDLRAIPGTTSLDGPLADFLGSSRVNQRTDDDKTLILATKLPPRDATTTL